MHDRRYVLRIHALIPLFVLATACAGAAEADSGRLAQQEGAETMKVDSARVFPEVSGKNLEGREFRLPRDFGGRANLILIAFRREQQQLVDTWMPAASALADSFPGLRYYELPTIGRGYALFRSFIDGGMRSGISDGAARERTITLYIDKADFRRSLGIESESTIWVLVVDRRGRVVHMTEGAHTRQKGEAVGSVLREIWSEEEAQQGDASAP